MLIVVLAAMVMSLDRLAFLAVCGFVVAVTWNGFRLGGGGVAQGGAGALNNIFLVISVGATFGHTVVSRRPIRIPPWMLAAAGGLVMAAMLTLLFPPDDHWRNESMLSYRTEALTPVDGLVGSRPDLLTLLQWEIGLVLIPVMLMLVAPTARRVKLLIDLFVVSCLVNAGAGLLDYDGIDVSPYGGVAGGRATGLTLHPNYLSLTCTIAIPLALYWITRGGRWRTVGVASTLLLLAGAYVSGGRAGAVTAPLALIATVALLPQLRRALGFVIPLTGILIVAALAFTGAGDRALEQLRFDGDSTVRGSNSAREELAELAIDQFEASPIHGVGFGVIQDAHSIYLQLLASGGIIALLCFATYMGGLLMSTLRLRAGPERDVATAIALGLAMWLINGAINSQLADKYLYVLPGLLVALYYATEAWKKAPEPRPAPPVRTAGARPLPAGAQARDTRDRDPVVA